MSTGQRLQFTQRDGEPLTVSLWRSNCPGMKRAMAIESRVSRLPRAIMLMAVVALLLHGILAPVARAQTQFAGASTSHSGEHCAGHAPSETASSSGLHVHDGTHVAGVTSVVLDGNGLDATPPAPERTHPAHEIVCCTVVGAALLPQSLVVSRSSLIVTEPHLIPASILPPGVFLEGPRKPPRTTDQG